MRRQYTNELVMAIAVMLLFAASGFAWLRSRPIEPTVPPTAPDVERSAVRADDETFVWQAMGEATYQGRCAACHGEGQGTRRVPPLRGHVVNLFEAEGGRAYLIDFLLYGLEGPIRVGDAVYTARHPIYASRMSDEEVAAVLNHMLTHWGNIDRLPKPHRMYRPDEVAGHRERTLTSDQVRTLRPSSAATFDTGAAP